MEQELAYSFHLDSDKNKSKLHKAIIKDKTYLFFNSHDYFYINDLTNKYPLSSLREIIKAN